MQKRNIGISIVLGIFVIGAWNLFKTTSYTQSDFINSHLIPEATEIIGNQVECQEVTGGWQDWTEICTFVLPEKHLDKITQDFKITSCLKDEYKEDFQEIIDQDILITDKCYISSSRSINKKLVARAKQASSQYDIWFEVEKH